jgi:hypothetical protein
MITIKRQFIQDAAGIPIGVILPIQEFVLVKDILEQQANLPSNAEEDEQLRLMEQAASDPLFIADMHESMAAFSLVDSEWWEPAE